MCGFFFLYDYFLFYVEKYIDKSVKNSYNDIWNIIKIFMMKGEAEYIALYSADTL